MIIRSFQIENYKGFRDAQRVDLAPLTLFYGENSSGKSALLRLLPWISESLADKRPGPCLDGEVARDALWSDLAHVSSPHKPVKVSVEWSQPSTSAAWEFRSANSAIGGELQSLTLTGPGGTLSFKDDGDGGWEDWLGGVEGMLPRQQPLELLKATGNSLMAYSLSTQWLRGVRLGIPRIERYRAAAPSNLLASGEGVARFLYHWQRWGRSDRVRDAVELVLAFYRRLGFRLETTDVAPGFFRLDVAADGQVMPVNLIDTGEGLTQVLAPLIALARAATGIGPGLVALEQPELHLHTDAQVELATSLIDAVNKGAQVMIETHSEVLFAAIQLALARRELRPDMVKLYWVARRPDGTSVARPVTLDERGHVDGLWPMDAFDDLLKLKSALYRAYRGGE